jgi:PAS domain S-box-containing protein
MMEPKGDTTITGPANRFLSGGGELEKLIYEYDWSTTSAGAIDTWPQSLRTSVNICLNSKYPCLVMWGKDMVRIYNSAYAALLGKRHPSHLGSKGRDGLTGTWDQVGPLLENSFLKGEAGSLENQAFLLDRHGYQEECYFSFSFSPVFNEEGATGGVFISVTETTEMVMADKRLKSLRDKQLASLFLQAPIAICILKGPGYIIETANERMLELWGKTAEQVMNKSLFEGMPDAAGQGYEELLHRVYTTGERFVAQEMPVDLYRNGKNETVYVKFVYEALKEDDGTVSAVMALADEITGLVTNRKIVEESEARLRMAVESTKLGTWDYNPGTGELNWSDECRAIYAFPADKKIDFDVFSQHIYPEDKAFALSEISRSMDPSGSGNYDITYRIIRYTDRSVRWIRATGKVYFNTEHQADRFIGTVLDITESRQLEETIRESEQRTRLAIDAAQMGTFDWDIKASTFIYSERLANIFGYTDVTGLQRESMGSRIHPDDQRIRMIAHDESMRTGVLFYEARIVWPDESLHWVRFNGKIVYDDEGAPFKMYGTALDITEQKTIIHELEESERRFKTLADTTPVMIWTTGTDKEYDFFNKGWLNFTGRTLEEELGGGWIQGVHPDDLSKRMDIFNSSFNAKKKFSTEFRLMNAEGKYRWVLDEGTPRYDGNGIFMGYIGSSIDVQERKMAREELERKVLERTSELNKTNSELRQQKEFVDTILESSVDVVIVLDNELRYVTLNRKACELYGISREEATGRRMIDIFPLIRTSGMYDDLQEALSGQTVHAPNYRSTVLDKHFENFYVPLKDRNDKVYGVLVISHDNTAIIKAAEKLESTNKILEENNLALERSNRELESFSYVASHDLQEPLRKIRTFSELVQRHMNNEKEAKKYFKKIDSSAERMADLIKAVLNYSRLSKKDEHFVETDLNRILSNVKSDFELLISEKGVVIKSTKLPVIRGVPLQLNQLFSNLIGNSIKFSEKKPRITITSRIISPAEIPVHPGIRPETAYLELIFKDNGIGFEQQYSDQIFTIFKRLHGNQSYSGTGIGLALCKKIVENHKGFIEVHSEPGLGTEFFIYFPVS